MPRLVLVLLAALSAGIGFVMERPLLYAAAGVLVLGAIGLWVWNWRKERRREKRRASAAAAREEEGGEDNLRSLGIMEIRPQEEGEQEGDGPEEPPPAPETEPPEATEAQEPPRAEASATDEQREANAPASAGDASPAPPEEETEGEHPAPPRPEEPAAEKRDTEKRDAEEHAVEPEKSEASSPSGEAPAPDDAAPEGEAPRPELAALVRALRLAAGARAACLLMQEEWDLEYRVEAADAGDEAPPFRVAGDTFSTEEPLLSAHAARRVITRRDAGGEDGVPLTYYPTPPTDAPGTVVLVPLPLPDDPATRFLLLDGDRDAFESTDEDLLERFAGLFARLLSAGAASRSTATAPAASAEAPPVEASAVEAPAEAVEPRGAGDDAAAPSENGHAERPAPPGRNRPRPRIEIIAEEMQQARGEGHALALALVYLNRAEAVAERGEDEVHGAERALRARLRRALPEEGGRVERFGELTYGVFLRRARAEAEHWAIALQEEMTDARDPLKGGVSVGLAPMRGPEQSPEALRENATNALREAYTTGTCTILE